MYYVLISKYPAIDVHIRHTMFEFGESNYVMSLLYFLIQHLSVGRETYDWLVGVLTQREQLSSAATKLGEAFVMIFGIIEMLLLSVDSLDS